MGKCRDFCQNHFGLIHPHSKKKFYWDLIIILLSIINAIYVPMEITFSLQSSLMETINYAMDAIFIMDIVVNFRTIYLDPRTMDPVTNNKMIALAYIKSGRFFVDFLASFPLEIIGDATNVSKGTLKLISLIKLTRLLRLSKIVTFIKMKKSLKHGIRLFILVIYLFLIVHFMACFAYYIFQINQTWIPPKDIVPDTTSVYNSLTEGYYTMFYYGALFLLNNDPLPRSTLEVICCTVFVFIGIITIGLLIGQFSSIIINITKKSRIESEKLDFIQTMMFTLKIPDETQDRIL